MDRIIEKELGARALKRQFTRAQVQVCVELTPEQGAPVQGHVLNLSLNGVLLSAPAHLEPQQVCDVAIRLEGLAPPEQVCLKGSVVRCEDQTIAITFLETDSESMQHLRNLVYFNAEHCEQVDREFRTRFGLHPQGEDE